MANQLHVAYSEKIKGAALFNGGPYASGKYIDEWNKDFKNDADGEQELIKEALEKIS